VTQWSLHNIRKEMSNFVVERDLNRDCGVELALDAEGTHFILTSMHASAHVYSVSAVVDVPRCWWT